MKPATSVQPAARGYKTIYCSLTGFRHSSSGYERILLNLDILSRVHSDTDIILSYPLLDFDPLDLLHIGILLGGRFAFLSHPLSVY